ncbi:putative phosphoribosyl transferase [Parvibaculum indicum]|uniref:dienelactone hydrolase family protein n=1 Tax=Parvibaculum indicum TaxID=562969 RepID=UPI00141DEC39|nr:dienelactone hydrolase family protein [Parvibaculum indicum]NIJ41199.1 putative phosphoribosyl transferase [Parvibaculum indicum]
MVVHEAFREIEVGPQRLKGLLGVPPDAKGLVIFAHGSGSSRLSPRNTLVAEELRHSGMATLLLDLLTAREEADRRNVFDMVLLAGRLVEATDWAAAQPELQGLGVGYFGGSTGAAAALVAAAKPGNRVAAVVSRGGRCDLANPMLAHLRAPVLLLAGSDDRPVVELNRQAFKALRGTKEIVIVPGAGHLFEERGAMAQVTQHALRWFLTYLPRD